jgi:hypothetical protein
MPPIFRFIPKSWRWHLGLEVSGEGSQRFPLLATQYLRTKAIKAHFSNGIVGSASLWRSPGSSEKLCPAL